MVELQQQERPHTIHQEQIDREEDNGDERDDCRILDLFGRRPRHALHFSAHVAQKLRHAAKWTNSWPAQSPLAARTLALGALAKAICPRCRKRALWVFYVIHDIARLYY